MRVAFFLCCLLFSLFMRYGTCEGVQDVSDGVVRRQAVVPAPVVVAASQDCEKLFLLKDVEFANAS